MRTSEFQQFQEGVSGVMSFYGKSVSKFALDVWWAALKNYDLATVTDAFNRHLMNPDSGQFAPKPADIIRMLQGSTQDTALQAWTKVDRAIRSIGTYVDVVFDDGLIHRVIQDMGGWIALGHKSEEEWPFVAKEFEARYRAFRSKNITPEYLPILTGVFSAENGKNGFGGEKSEPVLIGDHHRATQVMNGGSTVPVIQFRRAG
jgi:hypothetical protein